MTDAATLDAGTLLGLYRQRKLSPVEVAEAVFARIDRFDRQVNAFVLADRRSALAAARAAERRWKRAAPQGPLDGVPVTIKDLLLTRGWPTLRGSRTVDRKGSWREDAPSVARLRAGGGVLIGKTTTPEFGWQAVTESPLTGSTRNPWDLRLTAGGSSGGAAAAAALGMGTLHVGTDGGGSIRIPCALCGVFGLKPSFGRVPAYPLSPFGTVAHVGPMTRTVADAALMLTVMAGPDSRDWHSLLETRDFRIGLDDGVRGLKAAWSPTLGYAPVDAEVAEPVARAVAALEQLGLLVEQRDPGFADPRDIFNPHWAAGAAVLLQSIPEKKWPLLDPGFRRVADHGLGLSAVDLQRAQVARGTLGARMRAFHETCDLLLTPVLPVTAFEAGRAAPPGYEDKPPSAWIPFTYPFNLTQQPAASVPCGFTRAGLPVALQIVGPNLRDDLVLRAARALETAMPFKMAEAPVGRR